MIYRDVYQTFVIDDDYGWWTLQKNRKWKMFKK